MKKYDRNMTPKNVKKRHIWHKNCHIWHKMSYMIFSKKNLPIGRSYHKVKKLCHICVIYDMCHISIVIYHICVIYDSWNIGLPVLFLTVGTVIYDSVSYMTYQYHIWSYIRIYFAEYISRCLCHVYIYVYVYVYDNIYMIIYIW